MATADLEFNLKIKGTPDELVDMLEIMCQYDKGKDGVSLSFTTAVIDEETFYFWSLNSENDGEEKKNEMFAAARASGKPIKINAGGPYGRYGELNDVDIFRDMAEAAPNAEFEGSISGFAGYADQSLNAHLVNGKLHISTYYLADDVRGEAESDYIESCLPYEKFIEIFRLDSEKFDSEMYEEFMFDAFDCMDCPAEFFEETGYEEFLEMIGVDCPLTEEEYAQAAEQIAELDFDGYEEFLDENDYAICEDFTYDPIEKKYVGNDEPVIKSNTAYSINDNIREYLQSVGLPSDDEAINALSVDDVYAIMAGTYGKGDSEEAGQEEEISVQAETAEAEEEPEAEETAECECAETDAQEIPDGEEAETAETEEEPEAEETAECECAEADTQEIPDSQENEKTEAAEDIAAAETADAKPSGKRSKAWIVWLIIALVLVLAAAVCVFYPPAAEFLTAIIARIAEFFRQ